MFQPKSIMMDMTRSYIGLDDLKHQLFLNENMSGKDILEQLESQLVLKDYDSDFNELLASVNRVCTELSDVEEKLYDANEAMGELRKLIEGKF
jgi:DNA repair ATPase RecN